MKFNLRRKQRGGEHVKLRETVYPLPNTQLPIHPPLPSLDDGQRRRMVWDDDVHEHLHQQQRVLEDQPGQKLVLERPVYPGNDHDMKRPF